MCIGEHSVSTKDCRVKPKADTMAEYMSQCLAIDNVWQ